MLLRSHSKGRFAGIVDSGPGRAISGVHRECTCFEIGNCGGLSRHGCMACVSEIRATAPQGHGSRSVARGVGVPIATAAPDRKSVLSGNSVSFRVEHVGVCMIRKKTN